MSDNGKDLKDYSECVPINGKTICDETVFRIDKSGTILNNDLLQDALFELNPTISDSESLSTTINSTSTPNSSSMHDFDQDYSLNDFTKVFKKESLNIPCLMNFTEMDLECQRLGIKFNPELPEVSNDAYEVDIILDDKVDEGEVQYLVKWKNYSFSTNTWEPIENLSGCANLLVLYQIVKRNKMKLTEEIIRFFIDDVIKRKPLDVLTLKSICSIFHIRTDLTPTNLKKEVKLLLNNPGSRLKNVGRKFLDVMKVSHERKQTLINLKEWENRINECCPKLPFITVENDVDLEKAPHDFTFISDYASNVSIPDDPLIGCNCTNCYENRNCCCPKDSDGVFAYSRFGTIILQPGFPVYECNKRCFCGPDCVNRVVQHGSKVKLAIFRTFDGRGWGLKTLETIKKNQFVIEYLGEIISQAEAEHRGQIYDAVGRSYLFDLDFEIDDCSYAVDAGHVGNASHFMNHSCDPNVCVFAVWINQLDPHLPRLAFFAKRKIHRGEELTFDYKGKKPSADEDESSSRIPCKCGARNCRKFLYQ